MNWKRIIYNEDGVITVWLSLIFFVLCGLFLVLIWGTKSTYTDNTVKRRTDMAAKSVMSEYDEAVFLHYGLKVYHMDKEQSLSKSKTKFITYVKNGLDVNDTYKNNSTNNINVEVSLSNVEFKDSVGKDSGLLYLLMADSMNNKVSDGVINSYSYKGHNKNDILFCEYLLNYFSYYDKEDNNNMLNKDYLYELEYIIYGNNKDMDNLSLTMKSMGLNEEGMLNISEGAYKEKLRGILINANKELLCKRAFSLIVFNIEDTYGIKINKDKCYLSINASVVYTYNDSFLNSKFAKIFLYDNSKKTYMSEGKYSYLW